MVVEEVLSDRDGDKGEIMNADCMDRRSLDGVLLLCLLLSFFAVNSARALDPNLQISQYAHTSWTARDDAFRGSILSITQTPDGYLWLGTGFGLLRFDGVRFVEWHAPKGRSLPKPPFWKVYASRDGSLWMGANEGLTRLRNGQVTIFPHIHAESAIVEDREGTVWAGGTSGSKAQLCSIHDDRVHCFGGDATFGNWVRSIYEDPGGNLWVAAIPGVWRWKPGVPKLYPYNGTGGVAASLASDEHGTLLIANLHELRALIDEKDQAYPMKVPGGPISTRLLLTDKDGGVWMGTEGQGLVHMHQGKVDTYRREDGLSSNYIVSFFEDREGNIWTSTIDGLDRFRELAIPTITAKQGIQSEAAGSVLATRDGSLWIGGQGLTRIKGEKVDRYSRKSGLPDNYVSSVFEDRESRLLISTAKGCVWLQKGKFVRTGIPGEEAFSIAQDSSGNYWLADHDAGLIHAGRDGKVLDVTPWSKFNKFALSVASDRLRGGIWLGFYHDGLGLVFLKDGKIMEQYGPSQGFEGQVRDIQVEGDGTVWASTGGGLARLKDGKVAFLNSKNGLPCDFVFWKREDDQGSVWLLTPCGLVRLAKSELDAWVNNPLHKVKIISVFDHSDGVAERFQPGYYSAQVAKTPDGHLLFLQGNGLAIIDPNRVPFNTLKPPTVIEQITADDKAYEVSLSSVSIPPLTRNIRIDYTALSFVEPKKVRFRYKLESHDANWQDPGTRRQAFYSDLRPGHYRFRVIACNNDGVWNEEGATLDFRVKPAWYQAVWFRVSCVGAFALLLWALYQLRLQQLRRQFNIRLEERVGERTRIARELHDTLLQSFHGLMLRFQTAYALLPERPGEAKQNLGSAIDQAAEAITEGRDAVQHLRSSTVETNDLAVAIRTVGEELSADGTNQNAAVFQVEVEGTPRNLHPILRDEIYRIAAEALRNAFRHAHARQIEVELRYDETKFQLRIRDNGKGIDPKVLGGYGHAGHYGLPGMRERAKLIGGKLTVWSQHDSGTEVELSVPAVTAYATSLTGLGSWLPENLTRKFSGTRTHRTEADSQATDVKETKPNS
jgi:signal transduction histidine kinase/ligand-binding sensor domain-containing protein